MKQHLLIDADDTLWENNIYFEHAFDQFVSYLNHSSLSTAEVCAVLDEIELANIKVHGYGSANFARNLCQCYERLSERAVLPEHLEEVRALALRILEQPIELLEGIEPTLAYLADRHDLILFTKGHPEEQRLKLERSGLAPYFRHCAIVKEKDPPTYARLVEEEGLDRERTWMVGNSPKSDINPALAIGLKAVYIPHPRTWRLEREEVRDGNGRLLVLKRFSELSRHF